MESQKIIAIVNEKGGTCKTTTSVNLAAALGEAGKQVLLVDLDGQAASSRWVGVEEDNRLAEAMCRGKGLEPIRDVLPGVSLAPASGKLDSVAHDLRPTQGGQLRKVLGELTGFDFILIDCPPSLGNRLIGNALLAASHVLVPVETSILALDGLKILLTTLDDVREGFDHKIVLAGVLACRYDPRTRLSRLVLAELQRALPGKVFATVIRENVRMRECPASGQSILTFADDSHAAADYRALAKEIIASPQIWLEATDASAAAQSAMGEAVNSLRTNAAAAVRQAAGMDEGVTAISATREASASPVVATEPLQPMPAPAEQADSVTSPVAPASQGTSMAPAMSSAQAQPLAAITHDAPQAAYQVAQIAPSPDSLAAPTAQAAPASPVPPIEPKDPQPAASCQQPHKELDEELARLAQAQQHLLEEVESPDDDDVPATPDDAQVPADKPAPPPEPVSAQEVAPLLELAPPLEPAPVPEPARASGPTQSPQLLHASPPAQQPGASKPATFPANAVPLAPSPTHERFPAIPKLGPAAKPLCTLSFPVPPPVPKVVTMPGMPASAIGTAPADPSILAPADGRVAGDSGVQAEKKPDYPALREYMRQMAEEGRLPGAAPAGKEARAKEPKVAAWRRLFQKGA